MENQLQNRKESIPSAYCRGIQYYDLKNMDHISNAQIVTLIGMLKTVIEKGAEVKFVNVNERIKRKISAMGLENILNCG